MTNASEAPGLQHLSAFLQCSLTTGHAWLLNRSILLITAGVCFKWINAHLFPLLFTAWTQSISSHSWIDDSQDILCRMCMWTDISSSVATKAIQAEGRRDEKKENDEVETVWERDRLWCRLTVWIWRPDDLCLHRRLVLTVVSGESGANLKLSGDPQPRRAKDRASMLCHKPTEQLS